MFQVLCTVLSALLEGECHLTVVRMLLGPMFLGPSYEEELDVPIHFAQEQRRLKGDFMVYKNHEGHK